MERPAQGKSAEGASTRRGSLEFFKELWSQALVTVGAAEEEARRLLERLSEVVEIKPEDLLRYRREFAERLHSQRKDLERSVEDGVRKALGRLKVPSRDEIEALQFKLDGLSDRLDRIVQGRKARASASAGGKKS